MAEASLSSKLSGLERSHSAESSLSTRHPDRRKQLVAGLLRQMQRQYGSDAVRTRLIEGELQAAPELRGGKITPGGLQAVEKRVAASMKDVATGVGADDRIILPAVKKDRQRPLSANFNADLRDMASWTEVNKYRSDFFAYELQKEGKARQVALKKTQDQLAHQLREGQARKAALKDKVRREAEEEAARRAQYLADKAEEDAMMANKARMEQEMRSNQTNERRARRAVEQRLKDLEDGETLRLHEEAVQAAKDAHARKVLADEENNRKFVEDVERERDYREKMRLEADAEQQRLNAQWKEILDKQEFTRAEQYRLLRAKGTQAQKTYEDNAGAVDAARQKKEDESRQRYQRQFDKETKEKDAAKAAYRSKMERECQEGCMVQINAHNAARAEAKAAALKLKIAMVEQARAWRAKRVFTCGARAGRLRDMGVLRAWCGRGAGVACSGAYAVDDRGGRRRQSSSSSRRATFATSIDTTGQEELGVHPHPNLRRRRRRRRSGGARRRRRWRVPCGTAPCWRGRSKISGRAVRVTQART